MNKHVKAIVIVCALATPAVASAQSNGPVTRAQVYEELRSIEEAGYNPALANEAVYPADIQAAEARLAQRASALQTPGGANSATTRALTSP